MEELNMKDKKAINHLLRKSFGMYGLDPNQYTNEREFVEATNMMYFTKSYASSLFVEGCGFLKRSRHLSVNDAQTAMKNILFKGGINVLSHPLIFAIVGESTSGKSYFASGLSNMYMMQMLESYTTRSPRFKGENGHTFISHKEYKRFDKKDMLAYTEFGGEHYFTLKNDLKTISIYVIDERGLKQLKEQDLDVVSFRIKSSVEESERTSRDKGMFSMNDEEFDHVLHNEFSHDFLEEGYELVDMELDKRNINY